MQGFQETIWSLSSTRMRTCLEARSWWTWAWSWWTWAWPWWCCSLTESLESDKGCDKVFEEVTPGTVEINLAKHLPKSRLTLRASPSDFIHCDLHTVGFATSTCSWWPHNLQTLPNMIGRMVLGVNQIGVIMNRIRIRIFCHWYSFLITQSE